MKIFSIAAVSVLLLIGGYNYLNTPHLIRINGHTAVVVDKDTAGWLTDQMPSIYADTGLNNKNIATSWYVSKVRDSICALISAIAPITLAQGNGVTINNVGGAYTIGLTPPTVTTTARSANVVFTPSTTRWVYAQYTITCTSQNPLLAGTASASAILQYWNGTAWVSPSTSGNSNSVGLAVAIQLTNGQSGTIGGFIPPNTGVKIVTATAGSASINITNPFEFNFY